MLLGDQRNEKKLSPSKAGEQNPDYKGKNLAKISRLETGKIQIR